MAHQKTAREKDAAVFQAQEALLAEQSRLERTSIELGVCRASEERLLGRVKELETKLATQVSHANPNPNTNTITNPNTNTNTHHI